MFRKMHVTVIFLMFFVLCGGLCNVSEEIKAEVAQSMVSADNSDDYLIRGGTYGVDYTYADGVITILSETPLTIRSVGGTLGRTNRIEVAKDVSANIILAGVCIDVSQIPNAAAFKIADDSTGNVVVTLAEDTLNTLISGDNCAGIQKNGKNGTLLINGNGGLEVAGGSGGAGIGAAEYCVTENITIADGHITASGGTSSAGIGTGHWGYCDNISITGGIITAQGNAGAGIGGGNLGKVGRIYISGGIIIAVGSSYEPGIGTWGQATIESVCITGGSIKAVGGSDSKPIAGGTYLPDFVPINNDGVAVELLVISNPNMEDVVINGKDYPDYHIGERNVYAYLTTNEVHRVRVGKRTIAYCYDDVSKEFVQLIPEFVERMYTVALNRDAEEAGLTNWVNNLEAGVCDGAAIAKEFLLGEEFKLRGLSDEEFLDVLYQIFFNREADAEGKGVWLSVLASGQTREFVLSNFVNLAEFTLLCETYGIERGVMLEDGNSVNPGVPKFVSRLYNTVFGRNADSEGYYNNIMGLVVKSVTAKTAAMNFFESEEYVLKNTDDAAYVTDLYNVFMDRTPDAEGHSFWVAYIAAGMTREDVLAEFAKSEEFKAIATSYGLE